MSIQYKAGNLLTENAEALVNAVNTVGVMGKGIALQFKEKFQGNFDLYKNACQNGKVEVGRMFITQTGLLSNPNYIINFPTKQHWKDSSKIEYIISGLDDLVKSVESLKIKSIAIPPLGCGLGGLKWTDVKPLIVSKFSVLKDLEVIIFEPADEVKHMNIN